MPRSEGPTYVPYDLVAGAEVEDLVVGVLAYHACG
jgi:hypothetical protein